jgi:hypothetical protein
MIFGLADASRCRDPLPPLLQKLANRSGDTWTTLLRHFYSEVQGSLPSSVRDYLRSMYHTYCTRELPKEWTPSMLDGVRALFDPKDENTHRTVSISSECCSFSHKDVKLPSLFVCTEETAKQLGAEGPLPLLDLMLQSVVTGTAGFRRKKCSIEPACSGRALVDFGQKALNRVVVSVAFGSGDFLVDMPSRFLIEGPDRTSSHRVAGVVYGTDRSGFVSRMVETDGSVVEHDTVVENGRLIPLRDAKGEPIRWDSRSRLVRRGISIRQTSTKIR